MAKPYYCGKCNCMRNANLYNCVIMTTESRKLEYFKLYHNHFDSAQYPVAFTEKNRSYLPRTPIPTDYLTTD